MTELEELQYNFEQALLSVDRLTAKNLFLQSRDTWTPIQLADKVFAPTLRRIGTGWEQGKVALSQVYMSGRICEELIDTLLPPNVTIRSHHPKMAIAVLEDYHLLGKQIVYSVLRSSGFKLLDYGRVTSDELINRINDDGIEIILLSILMLPTAFHIKDIEKKLNRSGKKVKIIVGGAPFLFDNQLWKDVGANAMGRNASEAIDIVNKITSELK